MSSKPTDPVWDSLPALPAKVNDTDPVPAPAAARPPSATLVGATARSDDDAPGPAPRLPNYEVLGVLGRGGMGVVYRARQTDLQRLVALKMILAGGHAGEEQRLRFQGEAVAVARLQHPNIVQIHEVGEHDGQPYFSLELVDGGSLDKKLGGVPLPAREAAQLLETLARAMHAAHQAGIIHRDLKPANVLLTKEGQPKITDFGLAKQLDSLAGQTQTGDVMGTPSYMAPEQALGKVKEFGPGTDVYALGAILYETLTGRPPFKAESAMDTLLQALSEDPVPPGRLNPKVPRDLETIALKCLEKEQRRRYASAAALADDLRRFLAGEPILARPIGRKERLVKWAWRRPAAAALLAVSVLAALTVLGTILRYSADLRAQRDIADGLRGRAESKEGEARLRESEARGAERRARQQRQLAEERAQELRRHLYGASMNLAYQAWTQGNTHRALQLLEEQQPELRGFEWHCLLNLCHGYRESLAAPLGDVRALAFRAGDKTLLAVSAAGNLKSWDAVSWKAQSLTLQGHTGTSRGMAFAPDGKLLAVGYADGSVKLWDPKTGKQRAAWKVQPSGVRVLAFSPDVRTLASGGYDYTVRLWDVNAGKERAELRKHRGEIHTVAFSPDGALVASGGADTTVRLWDAATGKERAVLATPSFTYCLAFAPDGKWLAAGNTGSACVWDVATAKEWVTLPLPSTHVQALAFRGDSNTLALGTGLGMVNEVHLLDVTARTHRKALRGHTGTITGLAFTGDGEVLASASTDGTVKVWDVGAKARSFPQRAFGTLFPIRALAFDVPGRALAVAAGNAVYLWDVAGQRVRATLQGFQSTVTTVAYSPSGKWLATGEGAYPADHQDNDPKVAPGALKLWDAASGKLQATLTGHTHGIFTVAFAPDSKTLASGSWDGTVRLWDVATGKERTKPWQHATMVRSVAFAPDGKLLAAACGDRWANVESEVRLWDVECGKEVARLMHPSPVYSVAFAPDGKTLAAGVSNGVVQLWDVATRKERLSLTPTNLAAIEVVAFSPDGRTLLSGDREGRVHLWHAWSGQAIISLVQGGREPVFAAAFSPDGGWIATGSSNSLLLWDGTPRQNR